MSDTKWADVAHYYLRSGIKCNVSRGDLTGKQGDWRQTVEKFGAKHLRVNSDGMTFWCVPILRHLDDMTKAECIDYTEFVWADSEFSKVNRSQKISVVWAKDSVNLREMYRQCLFAVRQKGIMWPFFPNDINQFGFHWLVSRGFDVFGLIESGQAIRKEAGNGL